MKIGTKLAICFVALAVLPLSAASVMYLRATSEFGKDMAERSKSLFAERLTRNLRRSTEMGAITIEESRSRITREARFLSQDVAARLGREADTRQVLSDETSFLLQEKESAPQSGTKKIDLQRMSVHISSDAVRDHVAGTLNRLAGLSDIARTIYLRNRGTIDIVTITLESGLTISYPANAATLKGDQREQNWYLSTLESGEPAWFSAADTDAGRLSVAVPVQLSNGQLAGVARISLRLDALLMQSIDATRLPPEVPAYLIAVPVDDPELMPHDVAIFNPDAGQWKVIDPARPITLNGNDAWLKVVGDIRTGVPGLEYVERARTREVWAFSPVGATMETSYHLAVVMPTAIIETAETQAQEVVEESYKVQLRAAVVFALMAGGIAAMLALLGARNLTRPIRRLHEAAAKLTRGDFSVRVDVVGSDEISDLAKDFNRMVPALEEQLRVKRDLHAAREIQQHLVPKSAPQIDGFDLAGSTLYCDETGGDYLDYIGLDAGRFAVVIGDVTGHGVGAALLMATARAVMRANVSHEAGAAKLLAAVNRQLSADSSGGRSLTLFFMQLSPENRNIEWISAGHEPALIFDPERDTFSTLDGEDIPLGVDGTWVFNGNTATLPAGGMLVAYTDGIREAVNASGENFGLDRLKQAVRAAHQRGSAAVIAHVLDEVKAFRGGVPAGDDVSILAVRPVGNADNATSRNASS
ncbi:MAG: SpoIIE family protein phosphatase [Rhodospirillales bacterium]